MTAAPRVLVVSPVFNEGAHLGRTAAAIAAQRRPPDRWIVVDDCSTDDTFRIASDWAARLPCMTVARSPPGDASHVDGLAIARDARAFNFGLELAGWRDFDLIGKIDGDVELPPEWFDELVRRFSGAPRLGLAGGRLIEPANDGWKPIAIPPHHVHGAVKLYSKDCLEAIGGIPERLGWDTIDETYARMRGFDTWSYADLVARHHRAWGSAGGRLRGRARHGECAWILHYGLLWTVLRSAKVAKAPPLGVSGAAFLYGYVSAALRGVPRVPDQEFRRFARSELRARLMAGVRPSWRRRPTHPLPGVVDEAWLTR